MWNASDFGGIEELFVSTSKVWTPQLVLNNTWECYRCYVKLTKRFLLLQTRFDNVLISLLTLCQFSVDDSARMTDASEITPQSNFVWIYHSGYCAWAPRYDSSVTQCPIDVTWFPFDEQTCDLVFQSWLLKKDILKLISYNDSVDLRGFLEPEGWHLVGVCMSYSKYDYCFNRPMWCKIAFLHNHMKMCKSKLNLNYIKFLIEKIYFNLCYMISCTISDNDEPRRRLKCLPFYPQNTI